MDSSVGTVTGYGLEHRDSISGRSRVVLFVNHVQPLNRG